MKMEHQAIIDSARRHGCLPSDLAHQLLVHDLVEAAMFELHNIHSSYSKLHPDAQQEVIERITLKAIDAADTAVRVISARDSVAIPVKVTDSKFKEKSIAIAATADPQDPNRHGLIDLSGKLCLLVISPNDYQEGLDFIKPDRSQHELPLSGAELAAGLGLKQPSNDDDVVDADFDPEAPLPESGSAPISMLDDLGTEPTLEDVTRLVRETGGKVDVTFMQQHLAVDSGKATSLLFQLVEAGVIAVANGDAENSADFTYTVLPAA